MRVPKYNGFPLSKVSKLTTIEADISLWIWFSWLPDLPHTPATIERLVASGYEAVPGISLKATALSTQLYETVRTRNEDTTSIHIWMQPQEVRPVLLAFPLRDREESIIPMLQFLPAPSLGEYGFVYDDESSDSLAIYCITQLPEAAQTRCQDLRAALHHLALPSNWALHTPIHPLCMNELSYHRLLTSFRSYVLACPQAQREETKAYLSALEEAHRQIIDIRRSWLQQDWLLQWKEITLLAQGLAADYHAYHHLVRAAHNKPVPALANAFHMGMTEILTALPFQAYPAATIAYPQEWQQEHAEGELVLSFQRAKPSGTTSVQLREPLQDQQSHEVTLERMWKHIKMFSDLDADVYLAMVAQILKGVKDGQGNTWISAQHILSYRGIQPKRNKTETGGLSIGGHRWEDIEAIAACIKRMENIAITIQEQEIIDEGASTSAKRKRSRRTISLSSRLFMFGDTIEHTIRPLDGPPRAVSIAWQYRQSNWMVPFLEGPNRFTGLLFQKVLNYDPYHERWEKRLARHFLFWLRTNASREKKPAITILELLRELRLDDEIDERNPQRTRDHFEKAMERLATDGLLIWDYVEEGALPARKWLQTWLQHRIVVEDPPVLKSQYAGIAEIAHIGRQNRSMHQRNVPSGKGKQKN